MFGALAGSSVVGSIQDITDKMWQEHLMQESAHLDQKNWNERFMKTRSAEIDNQTRSAARQIEGLRSVGINPTGGSFAPIPSVSSPSSSAPSAPSVGSSKSSSTQMAETFKNLMAFETQMDLMKAEAQKGRAAAQLDEANAEGKRLENANVKHENAAVGSILPEFLDEMRTNALNNGNDFMASVIGAFQNSTDSVHEQLNGGDLKGFANMWFDFSKYEREREFDFLAKEIDKDVLRKQFENGAADYLATLPRATRENLEANTAQTRVMLSVLSADKRLKDAQTATERERVGLTQEQVNELQAQIRHLDQDTKRILHSDPAAMKNAGAIGDLLFTEALNAEREFMRGLGIGGGYAVGQRLAPGKPSASAPKPTSHR